MHHQRSNAEEQGPIEKMGVGGGGQPRQCLWQGVCCARICAMLARSDILFGQKTWGFTNFNLQHFPTMRLSCLAEVFGAKN
jgi:hypothetical protein